MASSLRSLIRHELLQGRLPASSATPSSIANVFRSLTRNLQDIDVEFTPFFTPLFHDSTTSDIRESPAFFPSPELIRSINGDIPRPYDKSLDEAVQCLPQELQDNILEFTVTSFTPNTVVKIEKGMRPPHLLHINRATRDMAAKAYYTTATFKFYYTWTLQDSVGYKQRENIWTLHQWLQSVPSKHRVLIASIRPENSYTWPSDLSLRIRWCVESAHLKLLSDFWGDGVDFWGDGLKDGVMKIKSKVLIENDMAEVEQWVSQGDLAGFLNL